MLLNILHAFRPGEDWRGADSSSIRSSSSSSSSGGGGSRSGSRSGSSGSGCDCGCCGGCGCGCGWFCSLIWFWICRRYVVYTFGMFSSEFLSPKEGWMLRRYAQRRGQTCWGQRMRKGTILLRRTTMSTENPNIYVYMCFNTDHLSLIHPTRENQEKPTNMHA